ncbi:MAG TPA: DMT family transporter [Solirubrobacteraceae bacterium]|nr:DMT family transporter [Solirubrobacteraceae bacterium]
MDRTGAVIAVVGAGCLVGAQAPINATLGRSIGRLPAATVSFAVGLAVLLVVTAAASGFGGVANISGAPWWALTGGLFGAVYVTVALTTVGRLGAGGVTAATVAGQLTASVLIDGLGLFGVERQPVTATRIAGIALLALGVYLVVRD